MFSLIVAFALGAGPEFTVTNKMPPFVAVNRMPTKTFVTKTITTYRNPVGHTHTDAHGHTWDHQSNPSHVCKICGMTQYAVDRVPRMVPVVTTAKFETTESPGETRTNITLPSKAASDHGRQAAPVADPVPGNVFATPRVAPVRQVTVPAVRQMMSNCPNGNCSYR